MNGITSMNNLNAVEQLVPVFTSTIGNKQVQVCDARALHTYLGNGDEFAHWIKARIEKYEFVEKQDFLIVWENTQTIDKNGKARGSRRTDYHLTINMAKELGMVENNEKGRTIRRYFIAMEQRTLNAATIDRQHSNNPQDYQTALLAFADAIGVLADNTKTWANSAQTFSDTARVLSEATRALATNYEPCVTTPNTTQNLPSKPVAKSTAVSPLTPREDAFIHAWWECFGSQTVTASDLYRAIATKQCQVLNDSSSALLGDIELWTAKKLSHSLRRWSQLTLDGYKVQNVGKSSHGIAWRLELLTA